MDLRFKASRKIPAACISSLLFFYPAGAFAFSDFAKGNPNNAAALIYLLLFILVVLLIVPLYQFYLHAVESLKLEQERKAHNEILDSFSTGVVYLDSNGKTVSANETAPTLFKTSESQLLNREFSSLFSDGDKQKIEKAYSSDHEVVEAKLKNSNEILSVSFGELLTQGKVSTRIVIIHAAVSDVSGDSGRNVKLLNELSQAKKALVSAKSKNKMMFTTAPVAVGKMTKEFNVVDVNENLLDRLSFKRTDVENSQFFKLFAEKNEANAAEKELRKFLNTPCTFLEHFQFW